MKRALVLSGGGARGSYQVGMLRHLVLNLGLDFQIIRGVSVGALNAAFLAQASNSGDSLGALQAQVDQLVRLWREDIQGNRSVYRERPGGLLGLAGGANSLYSLKPLEILLKKYVSLDLLRSSGRDFKVGTVSLVSSEYQEWAPTDDDFIKLLLASAAIPVVFPFKNLSGKQEVLVDGGVRAITPLSSAFGSGPDEIYVLLASQLIRTPEDELPPTGTMKQEYKEWDDNWSGLKVGGFDVLKRTVDILSDEVYLDDLKNAIKWNQICGVVDEFESNRDGLEPAAQSVVDRMREALDGVNRRQVELYVIAPREWYGKSNSSTEFSPDLIGRAIAHGEAVARDPALWFWPPIANAGSSPTSS